MTCIICSRESGKLFFETNCGITVCFCSSHAVGDARHQKVLIQR